MIVIFSLNKAEYYLAHKISQARRCAMDPEQSEDYAANNALQRDFALRTWKYFTENMKSEISQMQFNNVIDFGCGTGEITTKLGEWISQIRYLLQILEFEAITSAKSND